MNRISFRVNGVEHSVGGEVSSDLTLLDYIRNTAELRGTKYMCREAGCGACIVTAVKGPDSEPLAVNSCMVSVTSCQDWDITTVEKVGNKLDGYNILQTTLAEYNGTQCGHCTPGWIMAMYSLLKSKRSLTMLDIEKSFGSNVCRCTGYRPILEAFKKFAIDSTDPCINFDIEDLHISKKKCQKECKRKCKKEDNQEDDWCFVSNNDVDLRDITEVDLKDGKKWFRVRYVSDIFTVLRNEGDDSYMLVAGNTAKGAYPIFENPRILIDISGVNELKGYTLDQNLVIGAGTTLTETLDIFQHLSNLEYFEYLKILYKHVTQVAHIPVRNLGSLAGNLMIKNQHREFPSDVFLLFETVGAQLTIGTYHGVRQIVTMEQFLTLDMHGRVILNAMLPPLNKYCKVVTFKIMPKSQNAHAIVNAGFLYNFNTKDNHVVESRIVFGGLAPTFVRATATENCLLGKQLFTNSTLQSAINVLKNELVVIENPPEPSAVYRKQLAINLFYKGLLSLCPTNKIFPRYHSASTKIHETRPVSEGRQIFTTNKGLWPLNQPIPKLEALTQCSGEARYTEDIPSLPREVFAAFVLSTVPSGNIVSIHPGAALAVKGVIAFYTAKDIPGSNTFVIKEQETYAGTEEILASSTIKYFNQPIGIIVGESYQIAERAAKMVRITYSNVRKPVIDIKEAKENANRNTLFFASKATNKGTDIAKVISGNFTIYGQFHFTMETLVCVSKPTEEGLEVHAATQWLDAVQRMTAFALNMDENRIDAYVTRLGGAFGIKITRETQVAVACNLVAYKLNRPCRFILPLRTITRAIGKRFSCSTDFEVAVDKSGLIQYLNYNLYEDNGYKVTELLATSGVKMFNNCYDNSRWNYNCYNSVTDKAKNTWFRAPGSLENISTVELFMERISYELSIDPLQVRFNNLSATYRQNITEMVTTLKLNSDHAKRRTAVDSFNIENRWKKRGLRFSLMRFAFDEKTYWDCNISVYHGDGTVSISHSGVEMGQGVNTKAAQVCAYLLNIPLDKIKIKRNDTMLNPNSFLSGGSFTSPYVVVGVRKCCEEILKRLEPIRIQMGNPTWEELIRKAFESGVDLQFHSFVNDKDAVVNTIYGVALAEVEVDILTGESEILRIDLLQDVGQSISPEIDIGQVEGAFIMGLGYWTTENLIYTEDTGELLTDRTWNYYVPQARDIPQDFRVYFRKNSYSTKSIFGSKAVGEPPLCLSLCVPLAIREAITSARLESGIPTTNWFNIDGPYTVESIYLATATKIEDFKFY